MTVLRSGAFRMGRVGSVRKAREHTQGDHRVKVREKPIFQGLFAVLAVLGALGSAACAAEQGTIGAVLGQRPDGRLFVRDVPPLLAARKSGLLPGDEILLIDGK